MSKIKQFSKESPAIPFILLFAVMFIFFAGVSLRYGDDAVYAQQLSESNPLEMALLFRQTWSARLVIELISFTLFVLPPLVWKILNSLVLVLLAYSFSKLCGSARDRHMNWLACGVLCVYPLGEMISAGWVVTSCNYLWPLALGMYALTPWASRLAGRRAAPHSYALSLLALVYAANADQMLAILIGFTLAFLAWMLYKKQRPGIYAVLWLVVLAGMLALYLTAPGTSLRLAQELEQYGATYTDVHPVKRLYDVFMTASWYLLLHRGLPFILLAFCLCVTVFTATQNLRERVLAAIPLGIALALGPLLANLGVVFPGLRSLSEYSASYPMQFNSSVSVAAPFLLFAAAWALLLATVARWVPQPVRLPALLVLAAGLCSVLIMSFVPSAAISFQRYTLFIQMSLLFSACLLLASLHKENRLTATPRLATAVLGAGSLASLYLSR